MSYSLGSIAGVSDLDTFPPTSYRRLCQMMRQGRGFRAPGPCGFTNCTYVTSFESKLSPPFTWDHCHAHDYVRGMLCRMHNGHHLPPYENQDHWALRRQGVPDAETIAWLMLCPTCAELGPWHPLMVRQLPYQVSRSKYLLKEGPRRAARDLDLRARAEARRVAQEAERVRRSASALKGWETRRAQGQAGQLVGQALDVDQAKAQDWPYGQQ